MQTSALVYLFRLFASGQFQCPGAAHHQQQNQAQPKGQHTCLRHVHKVPGRKQIPAFGLLVEIDNHCCTLLSVTPSGTIGAS